MAATIVVAGATGNLGGRIVDALLARGAAVRALVRPGTDAAKRDALARRGADVAETDYADAGALANGALARALRGAAAVVSALQGLHEVVVGAQSVLLDAALAAGVPRFIPSDFSSDYTKLPAGENRNFDLRREFNAHLDTTPIRATSVLNGAFGEILTYGTPLLDFERRTVGYWDDPDWRIDFTTTGDAAAYTAAAALDPDTPRVLRIAGFQVSPREVAAVAERVLGGPFALTELGTRADLAARNRRDRAGHPEGERELYPRWQQGQYLLSMFSVQQAPLDNDRYPGLAWTTAADVLAGVPLVCRELASAAPRPSRVG